MEILAESVVVFNGIIGQELILDYGLIVAANVTPS